MKCSCSCSMWHIQTTQTQRLIRITIEWQKWNKSVWVSLWGPASSDCCSVIQQSCSKSSLHQAFMFSLCSNSFTDVLIQLVAHFGGCSLCCCSMILCYTERCFSYLVQSISINEGGVNIGSSWCSKHQRTVERTVECKWADEPEAVQLFHLLSCRHIMCLHLPFPQIYQLLGFADVEQQPVRCLDLLSIWSLLAVCNGRWWCRPSSGCQ